MKWQWKVHFIRPSVANPLIRLFAPSQQSDHIECRRHERGTGGLGGLPTFFLILGASMCVFNGVFYAFGTRFQSFWSGSFAREDISCHARNQMLDKIVFRQSRFFFTFFLQHVSLTLFHLCPRRFFESTFSTYPWWSFKELCFHKDIHLVFSITCRTPLRMQASSRFGFR